jgi:hypothetical protein
MTPDFSVSSLVIRMKHEALLARDGPDGRGHPNCDSVWGSKILRTLPWDPDGGPSALVSNRIPGAQDVLRGEGRLWPGVEWAERAAGSMEPNYNVLWASFAMVTTDTADFHLAEAREIHQRKREHDAKQKSGDMAKAAA